MDVIYWESAIYNKFTNIDGGWGFSGLDHVYLLFAEAEAEAEA